MSSFGLTALAGHGRWWDSRTGKIPVLLPPSTCRQKSCHCFFLSVQLLLAKYNFSSFLLSELFKCHTHLGVRPLTSQLYLNPKPHFSLPHHSMFSCSPGVTPSPPVCQLFLLSHSLWRILFLPTGIASPNSSVDITWIFTWLGVCQKHWDLHGLPCHKIQKTLHFHYKIY